MGKKTLILKRVCGKSGSPLSTHQKSTSDCRSPHFHLLAGQSLVCLARPGTVPPGAIVSTHVWAPEVAWCTGKPQGVGR